MMQRMFPGVFRSGSPEGMVVRSDDVLLVQQPDKPKRFARAHLRNSATNGPWIEFTSIPEDHSLGALRGRTERGVEGYIMTGLAYYPREVRTDIKVYKPNAIERWMYSMGRTLLRWK